jgi:uncharacterized protein (TIGR03435 family)
MFVETAFWFHPLVWWIGKRMVEERERACDEEVLRLGSEPRVYAEGILSICKSYVECPVVCVSGVTGANLKKRIEAIMAYRVPAKVNVMTKLAMAVGGVAAVVIPTAIGSLQAPSLRAQSVEAPPKFEIASVKPCALELSPDRGGRGGGNAALGDPSMFRTPCVTVRRLVQTAYVHYANGQATPPSQLKNQPVEGGPDWIDTEKYVVDARPASPQARATMGGPMLQALLEERFKVKIHRENRKVSAYALVVANGGPKLQPTPEGGCTRGETGQPTTIVPGQPLPCGFIDGDATGIRAVGVPISALCSLVYSRVHQNVIDRTGLSGLYNFHLGFDAPPPGLHEADDPDGFALARTELRKLGLELKSTTGDAEFIVIDHIERPTRN